MHGEKVGGQIESCENSCLSSPACYVQCRNNICTHTHAFRMQNVQALSVFHATISHASDPIALFIRSLCIELVFGVQARSADLFSKAFLSFFIPFISAFSLFFSLSFFSLSSLLSLSASHLLAYIAHSSTILTQSALCISYLACIALSVL